MHDFWLVFVPLFVAVDAIGTLPMFLNFTEGLDAPRRRKLVLQSALTAMAVALVFLAVGQGVLGILGITVADFMIAGGALLFVLSLNDMLTIEKKELPIDPESLGAVPLGVPLIVGPAVLTTSILLVGQYGFFVTASATVANILIAGFIFSAAAAINRLMGKSGAKTISKLASLILAAIAVMMIRKGIVIFLTTGFSPHM
ncbi:MAG: MarC family protein [Endomicrobiales bacterium]